MYKIVSSRDAIALLTTVFFIMLITVSVGVGLKYIKEGKKGVYEEQVMLQTSVVTLDILNILKSVKELEAIDTAEGFYYFLEASSLIPFSTAGFDVLVTLESARSKINPNIFKARDSNTGININESKELAFEIFLDNNQVDLEYKNMLLDLVNGIKEDGRYNTDIFNERPYLFRDYITSYEHLDELSDIYKMKFRNNSLTHIDVSDLFYPSNESNYSIDLNHATALTWEFMLGCSKERASILSSNEEPYSEIAQIGLEPEEILLLEKFNFTTYSPHLDVTINLSQGDYSSKITFEYDIKQKKGTNFVLKV